VAENAACHEELVALAEKWHGLTTATAKNMVTALSIPTDIDIVFLPSVPNQMKDALLNQAKLLVYTPSNEHFGIVPLEAMLAGVPVLAANSGGPLETVVDGETGWLRPVDKVEEWTEVMADVLSKLPEAQLQQMSEKGKERVKAEFSNTKMAQRLEEEIQLMVKSNRSFFMDMKDLLLTTSVLVLLAVAGYCVWITLDKMDIYKEQMDERIAKMERIRAAAASAKA
jgi:alpha-1,3/alpha-1,6-mannosyltransferase